MATATINRSNIMKSAWTLVKSAGYSLSNALKEAWSKFKKTMATNISNLTNEELKAQTFELLKESFSRGGEAGLAAIQLMKSYQDLFEKEEIRKAKDIAEAEKAQAEAKKQAEATAKSWALKKQLSQELVEIMGTEDLFLTVWSSDNKGLVDRRVYLKTGEFYRGLEVATYFLHGNNRNAPDTCLFHTNKHIKGGSYSEVALKAILNKFATAFLGTKIDIAKAINS